MPATHYLPDEPVHFTWDAGNEPVLDDRRRRHRRRRDPRRQRQPDRARLRRERIAGLDWDRVYPLAGPIAVEGAEPGDTLAIEILDLHTQGWGWTAILPGPRAAARRLPRRRTCGSSTSRNGDVAYLRDDIAIPLEPFFGTMGVCPAGASAQPVMPPGTFGGNMDTRQLVRGTTLYLPVQVDGRAVLAAATRTAAQGDGEVCVTGLEAPMYGALRFTLREGPLDPGAAVPDRRRR